MIEIHGAGGKIGEVSLEGGTVTGSTPALRDVAGHMLRKHGTPQKAFRALATLNNGYVWAQNPVQQHAGVDLADVIPATEGGPVPDDKTAVSMFTAHRVDEMLQQLGHATERMTAARAASGGLRAYHSGHIARHLGNALDAAHALAGNIRAHYPAEAAELEAVKENVGLAGIAAQLVDLIGDGHGHHVPGTPDVYRHGFIPISGTALGKDGIRRPGGTGKPARAAAAKPAVKAAPSSPPDLIGQYKGWRDGLTPAEDKALRFYQSPGFALMNGQLRGLDTGKLKAGEHATDDDLKRARKATKDLKGAIAKAPPLKQDTTVYRGFDAGQFGDLAPGKVVKDPGFMSTSVTDDAGAVGRAGQAGQMTLTLPAGTKAAAGSVRELILPPGSSLRITSVAKTGGVTHVKAELVPQGASLAADDGEAITLAKSLTPGIKAATTSHLLETCLHECTHGIRHAEAMTETKPEDVWSFNYDHCQKHLAGGLEHAGKLQDHFRDNYPDESRWIQELQKITSDAEDSAEHARYAGHGGSAVGGVGAQLAGPETISDQAARPRRQ